MLRNPSIYLVALLAAIISGCKSTPADSIVNPTVDVEATARALAKTLVAQTALAAGSATPTVTPSPSATPLPSATPTAEVPPSPPPQPTTALPTSPADFQPSAVCLHASLIDETIPDNSLLSAGEPFEKTWILRNIGSCTWTEDFSLVYHHGNAMSAPQRTNLAGWVKPGETVALTLQMIAPRDPGTYIGFWNLEDANGTPFGVGPSADVPIWVQIIVPGPTPEPITVAISASRIGKVKSDGVTGGEAEVGDTGNDFSTQGFVTFDLRSIPQNADVRSVSLFFNAGYQVVGSPFEDLGCLNVYQDNYGALDPSDYFSGSPSGELWVFCSAAGLEGTSGNLGGSAAISAVQDGVLRGELQLRFQFAAATDSDGTQDFVRFSPWMNITYSLP